MRRKSYAMLTFLEKESLCLFIPHSARLAAMTALMVCRRFSASSKTMERGPSKTSSVTSMQSMPNFS